MKGRENSSEQRGKIVSGKKRVCLLLVEKNAGQEVRRNAITAVKAADVEVNLKKWRAGNLFSKLKTGRVVGDRGIRRATDKRRMSADKDG